MQGRLQYTWGCGSRLCTGAKATVALEGEKRCRLEALEQGVPVEVLPEVSVCLSQHVAQVGVAHHMVAIRPHAKFVRQEGRARAAALADELWDLTISSCRERGKTRHFFTFRTLSRRAAAGQSRSFSFKRTYLTCTG